VLRQGTQDGGERDQKPTRRRITREISTRGSFQTGTMPKEGHPVHQVGRGGKQRRNETSVSTLKRRDVHSWKKEKRGSFTAKKEEDQTNRKKEEAAPPKKKNFACIAKERFPTRGAHARYFGAAKARGK